MNVSCSDHIEELEMLFTIGYIFLSVVIAAVDIIIAILSFMKRNRKGVLLGSATIFAAIADSTYLVSVITANYFVNSLFTSFYFMAISIMLNFCVLFIFGYTGRKRSRASNVLIVLSLAYLAFDCIVMLINPFREIAMSFTFLDVDFAAYTYVMKPLYRMHLIYAYILVASILIMLISTAVRVAKEYKMQYILPAVGILIIVLINALFLYAHVPGLIGRLDVSLILYSAVVIFLYWCCFVYARKGLIGIFKTSIFDSLDLGIVLFGYDDRMFLCNEKIKKFIPGIDFNENLTFDKFIEKCKIRIDVEKIEDVISFQWIREHSNGDFVPFLCNYKNLKNAEGRRLGKLMTFEDARLETDFITGFHSWESFNMNVSEMKFKVPAVVTCCDINGLSVINNTYGMGKGDQIIGELAGLHRDEFPADTYFVRGNDANLISISTGITEPEAVEIMERVRSRFSGTFQFALIVVEDEDPDMVDAILRAEKNVATWKLMDDESMRSNTLNSLIRALKECDADTESHVRRTQYLGIRLSRRIGLTDTDEAKLALLCVLHDIGKIGVPLEILNKPGKLSEDEWAVIKSHVYKGCEIAKSSTDYMDIAEDILHHHERWDGKGYPDGLRKETIPILSRIIAVVDAYDAMISKRPYKNKMTVAEAKQELIDNAGTQFDPTVVSEFIQLLEEEGAADYDSDTAPQETPAIFELNYKPSSARDKAPLTQENEGVYDVAFIRYLIDSDQKIIQVDEGFEAFTGYSREDIPRLSLGQPDLIPERYRAMYYVKVTEQLSRRQMAYLEHTLLMKNGKERNVICLGRPFYDSAAMTEKTEIIVFDALKCHTVDQYISREKENAENRLEIWEETFRRDSLTGLLNHSAFVNEMELKNLDKNTRTVFIMMDIDYFKEYNDSHGHRAGDNLLITLGNALKSSLRSSDISGRLGGDEFAAAMFFRKDADDALIRERVQETFDKVSSKLSKEEPDASFSMGVAISHRDSSTFTMLYDAADAAMYSAKNEGRNRLIISEE